MCSSAKGDWMIGLMYSSQVGSKKFKQVDFAQHRWISREIDLYRSMAAMIYGNISSNKKTPHIPKRECYMNFSSNQARNRTSCSDDLRVKLSRLTAYIPEQDVSLFQRTGDR